MLSYKSKVTKVTNINKKKIKKKIKLLLFFKF